MRDSKRAKIISHEKEGGVLVLDCSFAREGASRSFGWALAVIAPSLPSPRGENGGWVVTTRR